MTKTEAKDRLRIPEIWSRFNLGGKPAKLCSSPFRDDQNPSFSVSADGLLWNDFGTEEKGDAVDFLARIQGTSPLFKVQKFIELAASIYGDTGNRWQGQGPLSRGPNTNTPAQVADALAAALAPLRAPTQDECRMIGACRGLSPSAPFIAGQIGTLLIGAVGGFECWVLTDTKRRLAEARRLNGETFPAAGPLAERKAHTLRGSHKDWPVGLAPRLANHEAIKTILLVEGGPDYLAALQLVDLAGSDALPVAMLGAKASICDEARILIGTRRVIIPLHSDQAGERAADLWGASLKRTKAEVVIRPLSRQFGQDLNDMVRHFANDGKTLNQIATGLLR